MKKILFLGSGGSGKSTLFKQLRLIHGTGYNDNDREGFIKYVHTQIINQMQVIVRTYIEYNQRQKQRQKQEEKLRNGDYDNQMPLSEEYEEQVDELAIYDEIKLQSNELRHEEEAKLVLEYVYDRNKHCLEQDIYNAIKTLWCDEPVIKEIYDLRHITKIETSSAHFWDKLDAIYDSNYLPSNDDIMLCRIITTSLHEQQFEMKGDIIHLIDVGGQRSQRRKWMHCFEYVVAVIFIASLSCYDEILDEEKCVNSMEDQLDLFGTICNNLILRDSAMILFLNKTDLFHEKYCVKRIPLSKCDRFEDYVDSTFKYEPATKYIIDEFEKLDKTQYKKMFTHLTRATDTNNIQKVFGDVQEIVIAESLAKAGLLEE